MNSTELAQAIARHVVRMTHQAGASHVGSCLSCADILAVLYQDVLRVDPASPDWHNRDRFICSKGHAAAAVYAVLAERGFIPTEWLETFCQDGSPLAGHVTAHNVPGVDFSTGSLGHGLSLGCGAALAALREESSRRIFVLLSDGECQEGSTWEAAQFAGRESLKNLTAIIDWNGWQGIQKCERFSQTIGAWKSLGWNVANCDGHDHDELLSWFGCRDLECPLMIACDTTKGAGVSFMEDNLEWHYKSPNDEELAAALQELA